MNGLPYCLRLAVSVAAVPLGNCELSLTILGTASLLGVIPLTSYIPHTCPKYDCSCFSAIMLDEASPITYLSLKGVIYWDLMLCSESVVTINLDRVVGLIINQRTGVLLGRSIITTTRQAFSVSP